MPFIRAEKQGTFTLKITCLRKMSKDMKNYGKKMPRKRQRKQQVHNEMYQNQQCIILLTRNKCESV